jgi:hypothetical protein
MEPFVFGIPTTTQLLLDALPNLTLDSLKETTVSNLFVPFLPTKSSLVDGPTV